MERTKTDAERLQEESDAAMARQLQEQMDREEAERANAATMAQQNAAAAQPPAPPTAPEPKLENGVATVACQACTFINEVKNPVAGKRYPCIQCHTPLRMPGGLPERKKKPTEPRTIECSICNSVNRIPDEKGDAILCGACYQELGTQRSEPPTTQAPAEELRTVQIRCGECSAVNAVQVAADAQVVQFECGGCSTINEVNLS